MHTQKNGPSGASGPGSASLWRAEEGTLPSENVNIFVEVVGGTLWKKKQIFEYKSHKAGKLKGVPSGVFKHPICCKTSKTLKGGPFGEKKIEKSLKMPNKN